MPAYDLPLEELKVYRSTVTEPADFDWFWRGTLDTALAAARPASFTPYDAGLVTVECYDVEFSGYAGQRIRAWLILPRRGASSAASGATGRLPCVVEYLGYGGGRGFPFNYLVYASAGYAHFVMDTRGQGSEWQNGDTADIEDAPGGPQVPGFLTRGIRCPDTYYYRRLITDAVMAVRAAREHDDIDPDRVAVAGNSQGGGLSIVAAGLDPGVVACLPEVPFLCDFPRAARLASAGPYLELVTYCKTHRDGINLVFETLRYFDCVPFARRARAAALYSVGLMDGVCPPSTVFAAYNAYAGGKDIRVYEFNQHEGGAGFHIREKLNHLARVFRGT